MANANNKEKFVPKVKLPSAGGYKKASQIADAIATNIAGNGLSDTALAFAAATANPLPNFSPRDTPQSKRAKEIAGPLPNFACPGLDNFNKQAGVGNSNAYNDPAFERTRKRLRAKCLEQSIAAISPPSPRSIPPVDGDGSLLIDNVLNDYINVQYHMSLSMLSEKAAIDVQQRIPLNVYNEEVKDTFLQEVKRQGAIVLASTGQEQVQDESDLDSIALSNNPSRQVSQLEEATRMAMDNIMGGDKEFKVGFDPLAITDGVTADNKIKAAIINGREYYNIKALTLENVLAPSANNPFVSTMMTVNMTLTEPYGFKLVDDLRNLRCALGWEQVNTHSVMYRLDIKWSGYNPSTGEWVSAIPLNARKKYRKTNLTYYLTIANMEADVTATGTEYKISLIPLGATAFSGTDFSVDATGVFTSEQNTFGGFTDNLAIALNNRKKQNSIEGVKGSSGLERTFQFIMPQQLREAEFFSGEFASNHGYVNENKDKGSVVQMGRNTDLITMLRAALSDTPHVQESFISNSGSGTNNDFTKPRVHYTFRFNTIYSKEKVPNVNEYKSVTVQVIIEPFVTFRKGSVTPDTLEEYVNPESQKRRLEAIQNQGMIIRKYEYLNTPENTEVIDFGLNFSSFYLESFNRNQDWAAGKGIGNSNTAADIETRNNDISQRENLQVQISATPNKKQAGIVESEEDKTAIQRLFSGRTGAAPAKTMNNVCNPNQVFGGGFGITRDQNSFGSITSDGDGGGRKDQYTRELLDYVANDFLQIDNLKVRGDPVWMFTPYGNEIVDLVAIDRPDISNIITPTGDKIIFLDIRRANQNDAMDPNRKTSTTADPSYIGGFYNVMSVISTFEGGIFTQMISGAKMNHLNFVESQVGLEDFNNEDTSNMAVTNQDIVEPHLANSANDGLTSIQRDLQGIPQPDTFMTRLQASKARTTPVAPPLSQTEILNMVRDKRNAIKKARE